MTLWMGGEHVFSSTNYYYVTMCSVQLTDDSLDGRIVDLGAGWIHGIIGNPMSEMARRLNVELHHIPSDTKLYDAEGNPVPETQDRQVEEIFNKMLAEVHADMAGRGAKNDQSLVSILFSLWYQIFSLSGIIFLFFKNDQSLVPNSRKSSI